MQRFAPALYVPGLVILIFFFAMLIPRLLEGPRPGAGNMPVMLKPVWRIV